MHAKMRYGCLNSDVLLPHGPGGTAWPPHMGKDGSCTSDSLAWQAAARLNKLPLNPRTTSARCPGIAGAVLEELTADAACKEKEYECLGGRSPTCWLHAVWRWVAIGTTAIRSGHSVAWLL